MVSVFGQKFTIDLSFTAINNSTHTPLDSIKVMNRTQYPYTVDTVIYWPDTTLTLQITPGDLLLFIGYSTGYPIGVHEINQENKQFQLFQNYPNPAYEQSTITMCLPVKGTVNITITDVQGRVVIVSDYKLDKGYHSLRFTPVNGNLFFLTARFNGISRSIKILTSGSNTRKSCMLDYIGSDNIEPVLKAASRKNGLIVKESGILDNPNTNETYKFQFATQIPCPGTPIVTYEGQVYNTIQILSQCWLKQNLNVGIMTQNQSNNGFVEKFCYNNETDSCTKYGGLYQWNEMMQYTTQQGVQGICPPGWHLPADEEWKVLEGAVDSQYGIGDPEWDPSWDYQGYDAGTNLKTADGWKANGNGTDLFSFLGQPGGLYYLPGIFGDVGSYGRWWSSTEYDGGAWGHGLGCYGSGVLRNYSLKEGGFSVRCLRND